MALNSLLAFIAVGALAGWLASLLMRGGGFGLIGNIVVGIIGAFMGGWLFALLGIAADDGLPGSIVTATAGAVVLLLVVGILKKASD